MRLFYVQYRRGVSPIWPRSARFDAAVRQSHTVALHADLYSPGGRTLVAGGLDVVGGNVTASAAAERRRSCSVDLADRDGSLARLFAGGTVPPLELAVSRGIEYAGGGREMIPLGRFHVESSEFALWAPAEFTLACYDRSARVARNTFTSPYVVQPGTGYVEAAVALVRNRLRYPVEVSVTTSNTDTTSSPIVYLPQDDPWSKAAVGLVRSAGCEIFFDQAGWLVVRDERGPAPTPDFSYDDGVTSILLPDSKQSATNSPGYNGVLVVGESAANTVSVPRFLAVDDRPESPTYYWGEYGPVTEYVADSNATSGARAELIARARLRRHLGRTDTMSLATVPHPAHDPGDVVGVRARGADRLMAVESVSVPLDGTSAAALSLRTQLGSG